MRGRRANAVANALTAAAALALAACGAGAPRQGGAVPARAAGGLVRVVDGLGRSVEVPARPARIACLYAFSGHVVGMLGAMDRVVAVVEGLKRDKLMLRLYPGIVDLPTPSGGGAINAEELLRCEPSLVLVQAEVAANPEEAAKLDKLGVPYLAIGYRDMAEQAATVRMIGAAVGEVAAAERYAAMYEAAVAAVGERVAGIPAAGRVRVYHSVNEASRTDAPLTLSDDCLAAAGAVDVSVGRELRLLDGKHFASIEQIHAWNPQVILANEPGVAAYILRSPQWAGIAAVDAGKVYQLPIGVSRWGHPGSLETPLAVAWIAKLLYPDRMADLDVAAMTAGFYRDFFGLSLSGDEVGELLAGRGMRLSREESGTKE